MENQSICLLIVLRIVLKILFEEELSLV